MSKRPAWWLTVLAKIWPLTWISAKATTLPVLGPLIAKVTLPLFSGKNLDISYIPINENLAGESSFLPSQIVEELIRRSAHRVIINRCTCRDADHCENYPVELGCTLLGEGTREIDPRIARHVSVDEAIEHFHKTLAAGLLPMTGRVKIDNFIWGVKDRGKLLTVCHCCRCCCTILRSGKYLPRDAAGAIKKLDGLSISIDAEKCIGCGTCVEECFMGSLALIDEKALRDDETCKGCGRCATVCPQGAVTVHIESIDAAMTEVMGRIRKQIDFEEKEG